MSGFLKLLVLFLVVAGVLFLAKRFISSEIAKTESNEPNSFYDVAAEDDARLRAEPNVVVKLPSGETEPLKFKELLVEQQTDAEQLFEMALAQRKMGRLPGVRYGQMVQYCRMIIERYPDSEYAYKARRMLAEVPKRYWDRYKITEKEVWIPK